MAHILSLPTTDSFRWPEGKRAAVSLTFDDGRVTQPDNGFAILDRHGLRASFYVLPDNVAKRLEAWKAAVAAGHEIGNHTLTHPCTGNYPWSRGNPIEEYTLERIERELDGATAAVREQLGVTPVTFGYPCGECFVGRGENHQSYVPLVARRFLVGRSIRLFTPNDPAFFDPAHACWSPSDSMTFPKIEVEIDKALKQGGWLILAGHDIAPTQGADGLTTLSDVLDELCRFLQDSANEIWVDTVAAIGRYVHEQRRKR